MLVLDLHSDHKRVADVWHDDSVQAKKKEKRAKTVVFCAYMLNYTSLGTKY